MKTKFLILSFIVFFICINTLFGKTKLSLQKAIDKKIISAKSICAGGLELNYSITNLIKDSLVISIPAGWRFNSDAGKNDYQDILITHDEILTLRAKETKTFNIKGFCCESTKDGPIKGVNYTVGKLADSNLVALARYLKTKIIDENTQQYSIWAISDKEETANITSSNDSLAALIRHFVSNLKGEPLPWYTLLKSSSVSRAGNVNDIPVRFKAEFNYLVLKTCYSYCFILDDKGNKVSEIFGKWLHPESSDYKADFNVLGLKKGEYKLVLQSGKDSLFERIFKI